MIRSTDRFYEEISFKKSRYTTYRYFIFLFLKNRIIIIQKEVKTIDQPGVTNIVVEEVVESLEFEGVVVKSVGLLVTCDVVAVVGLY